MQDQTDAGVEAAGDAGAARYTLLYCYICVLVQLHYTAIYVSSSTTILYCYICSGCQVYYTILLYICILVLLYVSSCWRRRDTQVFSTILLCMHPGILYYTAIYTGAARYTILYCCIWRGTKVCSLRTTICVLMLLQLYRNDCLSYVHTTHVCVVCRHTCLLYMEGHPGF